MYIQTIWERELSESISFEELLISQKKIVKLLASGQELRICLDAICQEIETLIHRSGITASILTLRNGMLYFGGGPNINPEYSALVNELKIGPAVGSCGSAAFSAKSFYVDDISTSPEWIDFKDAAEKYHLRACWSTPILSTSNHVIGTFGVYSDEKGMPTSSDIDLINFFTNFASLAIEKDMAKNRERFLYRELNSTLTRMQAFGRVIPDLGLILSEDGYYVDIYGSGERLLYKDVKELLGKKIIDVLPENIANDILAVIKKTLDTNQVQHYDYQLDVIHGHSYFEGRVAPIEHYLPEDKSKRHVIWMARDITERKRNELEIEKLAFYDSLTNLPNRRLLMDRLSTTIKRVKRNNQLGALIFLDLDNFKTINDTYGHSGGDILLCEVSAILKSTLRESDTLSRIGGDEFVILLESNETTSEMMTQEAEQVCQRILEKLKNAIKIKTSEVVIGASLGITLIEGEGVTADSILRNADSAMYDAKKLGKGQHTIYRH